MVGAIAFLFVLGILIVVHEFGHFIAAKKVGVKVEKFSLGFGRKLIGTKKGDTEYTINLVPLGGYVKLAGDSREDYKGGKDEYLSKSPKDRAFIIFTGPLFNYFLGLLCFWIVYCCGYPMLTTKIGAVLDGFGAKKAGIQVGDKITAVDGKKVAYFEDMQKLIQGKSDAAVVKLSVERGGKAFDVDVLIKERALNDELGKKRNVGLIGITPSDDIVSVKYPPLMSVGLAVDKTWGLTVLTYKSLWRMITGKMSMRDSVTGPLGIFYVTKAAASLGFIMLIHLLAVLSLSLTIFNLLPLPILDGGHIMFLGMEKIRRRPLSAKTERIVTNVGLTVLMSLVVLITYNDIARIYGDKIKSFFK